MAAAVGRLLLIGCLCLWSAVAASQPGDRFTDSRFGVTATGNRVVATAVSCDERFVYFRIEFQLPFAGLIYTENAFPSCVYVNGSLQRQDKYDIRVPLQGCLTRQQPNLDYENAIIVQENPSLLEATDRKYLLTCVPGTSSSRDGTFTINFGGVTVQNSLSATEVLKGKSGGEGAALDYQVEIRRGAGVSGDLVTGALNVGDQIAYVVRIPDLRGTDARIGRCWAQDGNSEIQLSDERGCSVQTPGNVWNEFEKVPSLSGRIYYNNIKAWAFPTSNRVNIFCNLHVCTAQCQAYTCSPRVRRSAAATRSLHSTKHDVFGRSRRSTSEKRPSSSDDDADTALVETMQGGFSVLPSMMHTDSLIADSGVAFAAADRRIGVVTGVPPVEHRAYGDDGLAETPTASRERFCMDKAHFVAGLALMALVVLTSSGFMIVCLYRLFNGGGKDRRRAVAGADEVLRSPPHSRRS